MAYPQPGSCDRPGCDRPRKQRANSDRYWNRTCGADECEHWLKAEHQRAHRERKVQERLREEQGYDLDLPLAHLSPDEHDALTSHVATAMTAATGAGKSLDVLRGDLIRIFNEQAMASLRSGVPATVRDEADVDDLLDKPDPEDDYDGLTASINTLWDALIEASELLDQADRRHGLWGRRQGDDPG